MFTETLAQRWGVGKGAGRRVSAGEGVLMVGEEGTPGDRTTESQLLGTAEPWSTQLQNFLSLITSLLDNVVLI